MGNSGNAKMNVARLKLGKVLQGINLETGPQ
jgi:hypothetical protein